MFLGQYQGQQLCQKCCLCALLSEVSTTHGLSIPEHHERSLACALYSVLILTGIVQGSLSCCPPELCFYDGQPHAVLSPGLKTLPSPTDVLQHNPAPRHRLTGPLGALGRTPTHTHLTLCIGFPRTEGLVFGHGRPLILSQISYKPSKPPQGKPLDDPQPIDKSRHCLRSSILTGRYPKHNADQSIFP